MARVIDQVLGATTSSVVGEITRELVNASDGAGLHFNGSGYVSAGDTTVIDGATKLSVEVIASTTAADDGEMIAKAHASTALRFYVNTSGQVVFRVNNGSGNGTATSSGTVNDGNPTHIVGVWDGSTVKIYINGNEDGSAALSGGAVPNIADKLALGTQLSSSDSTANSFTGTLYRARIWNKAVDAKALYERADVDFADQYGRQAVRDGSAISSSNWSNGTGWSFGSGIATFTQSGGTVGAVSQTSVFTSADAGKNVRITFTVGTASATILIGNASGGTDYVGSGYTSYAAGTHTAEFTMPSGETTLGFWANGATFTISNISVHVEGCVSDYDLAFASPTQSRTVQDRAGVADGTASTSGVTQVQPIIQGNLTSLAVTTSQQAAGVPADGDIIVSGGVGVGAAAGAGGHGLTVDKVVNDDWVAKIKNSGNTTPYGLQVDCQGANAVTAFAVYAGSAPNNTSFTIKPSGVVVQGGDVGIGQTPTANFGKLQVYATGDQTDETTAAFSIGDTATGGMRIYGGVNNTTNYAYIGAVESGTAYRALSLQPNGGNVGIGTPTPTVGNLQIRDASGSTLALTRTAGATTGTLGLVRFGNTDIDSNLANILVYQDNATDAAAIAFQTQATGGATADRLTIGSDGLCTFANGIQVNDAAGGMAQIQTGGAITIADDASITLSSTINEGALISVHHNTLGAAVLFYVTFASVAQIISDSSSLGSATDTDGKMCMIKTANSHAMTFKNRLGSSVTFKFAQLGGNLV